MKFDNIDPFVMTVDIDEHGAIKNIKELSPYFQLYDYRNVLYNRFEKDKNKTIDEMFNSQLFDELLPRGSSYIDPIWKKNPVLPLIFPKNFVHTLKYLSLYRRLEFCKEHDFIILDFQLCDVHDPCNSGIDFSKIRCAFNKKIMFTRYSEETLVDKLFEKELTIKDLLKINSSYILIHHIYRGYPDYIDINAVIKTYKKQRYIEYAEKSSYQSTVNCKYYFDKEKFCKEKSLFKYQDLYLDGYLQCLLKHNIDLFNHIEFIVPADIQGLRFLKRKRTGNKLIIYDTITTPTKKIYYLCQRDAKLFYLHVYETYEEFVDSCDYEE